MAQNVKIAGASYNSVPSIQIPKVAGGYATFVDTSDANATAPDIQIGKVAYVGGFKVIGTGTGGGSKSIVPVRITDDTHQYVTIYVDIAADGTLTPSGAGKNGGQFYNPEIEPSFADFSGNQTVTVYWGSSATTYRNDSKQVTLVYEVEGGGSQVTVEPLSVTANGTYNAPEGVAYSPVTVNVPETVVKNVQGYQGMASIRVASYTATGVKLTVSKSGTYKVSWIGIRNTNSGTSGTQLYIAGKAYGSASTTFTNTYAQAITLTNVSLQAGQTVEVYARARSTSYYMMAGNLIIEEQ